LARQWNGEVISVDSRQVYRELNLGSGKDPDEYGSPENRIPHHLIDIADLSEEYTVFHFQRDCFSAMDSIVRRQRLPVLVGGTGMYLEAVLRGYALAPVPPNLELRRELDGVPEEQLVERLRAFRGHLHNTTDTCERDRLVRALEIAEYTRSHPPEPLPPIRPLLLGVHYPRPELRRRIRARLEQRLAAGMLDELDALLAQGVSRERLNRLGLEYRFMLDYREGRLRSEAEFVERLHLAICDFAKRQETWFRRMERQGAVIHWIAGGEPGQADGLIKIWLKSDG
jgi:tRNA dimethylallyltransferase